MSKKALLYSLSVSLLILIGLFSGIFLVSNHSVEAQIKGGGGNAGGDTPLTGFAWSSNIGWINFNPTFGGVFMDENGNLSGYAWANPRDDQGGVNNIGWLSFNDSTGCPSGSCQPHVDLSSGQVTGWAKFLSAAGSSGWDGWVHLSGTAADNSSYGVTLGAADEYGIRNFNNYAWGSNVVDWISFHGVNYGVSVGGLTVTCRPNSLSFIPPATVTWTANPTGGSGEYSYSWSGDDKLSGTDQSVTKTYETAGTYNGTVFVSDSSGRGGYCSSSVVIAENQTPPPPTITSAVSSTNCSPGVVLQWSQSEGATGYYLYKRAGTTGDFNHGDILSGTGYTDQVIAGTPYYYYVTAIVVVNGEIQESLPSPVVGPKTYTAPSYCHNVNPATVTLTAVPTTVPEGGRCTLNYVIGDASDCTLSTPAVTGSDPKFRSPGASFSVPSGGTSGSTTTSPIHKTQTYTLDCANEDSVHRSAQATCALSPIFHEF